MAKKKSSVLIVDDHPAMSVGLQLLLEKAGFQVVGTVDRANSALAAVKGANPDVVLLDTIMPGGDPFAAATRGFIAQLPSPPAGGFSPGGHDGEFWSAQLPAEISWLAPILVT